MSAISKPILYSYWRSSCSWRVRTVLNLKNIDYDTVPIHILQNNPEQHSEKYKIINPMGKVPALKIDGITLVESLSILHYLEETRPTIRLMPIDAANRAKVREICDMIASGIQPLQNVSVVEVMGDEGLAWAQQWITKGFVALEKVLEKSSGKYCVGDEITLADCCLIPQVFNARKNFNLDVSGFKIISSIDKQLKEHKCFKDGHPYNQPDCPIK